MLKNFFFGAPVVTFDDRPMTALTRSPSLTSLFAFLVTHRDRAQSRPALGEQFEAEPWDKGWTKIYETWPLQPFTAEYCERVARRLAEVIGTLHPIYEDLRKLE